MKDPHPTPKKQTNYGVMNFLVFRFLCGFIYLFINIPHHHWFKASDNVVIVLHKSLAPSTSHQLSFCSNLKVFCKTSCLFWLCKVSTFHTTFPFALPACGKWFLVCTMPFLMHARFDCSADADSFLTLCCFCLVNHAILKSYGRK